MQKLLLFLVLSLPVRLLSQSIPFHITGRFSPATSSRTLYLVAPGIRDSMKIRADGSFAFEGRLASPRVLTLYTQNSNTTDIWVNAGTIQIELEEVQPAAGSPDENTSLLLKSLQGPPETEFYRNLALSYQQIAARFPVTDSATQDSINGAFYPLVRQFIRQHPDSYLGPLLPGFYSFPLPRLREMDTLLQGNPNTEALAALHEQISQLELLEKGHVVPDFVQQDPGGKKIELYAIRKRFILLQFWSSNCAPCRAENPAFVKLYAQYHAKGFEIIGISLDVKKKEWLKAIRDDRLPWINISDLQGWKNELALKYQVSFLPFNILLDSRYAIIQTNISLASLRRLLEKASTR